MGLHTLEDNDIVVKAIEENRIILTADTDFGQILAFTKFDNVSVIQFRLDDLSPEKIQAKLEITFEKFTDHLGIEPVIITVQENKIRLKILPI